MNRIYNKHCLQLLDFSNEEINYLIKLSSFLKQQKLNKQEEKYLSNKKIILLFEQESTRTRLSFEIAAFDQGANISYINSGTTHIGYKESIEDTAKIISQLYDGVQYRGKNHKNIKLFSKYSKIPVWNGLSEKFHPTQLLSDLLTITENNFRNKSLSNTSWAYIGDTNNNIGNSILEATVLMGMDLRIVAPKKYWPNKKFLEKCNLYAKNSNAKILCTENIEIGVNNVDYIYTDVWVSMNEDKNVWHEKIYDLKKYQVNSKLLSLTNNPQTKILHCLPALHDTQTILGNTLSKKYNFHNGIEITNEIFRSKNSIIFEQSQNRMHTIKALMIATLLENTIY